MDIAKNIITEPGALALAAALPMSGAWVVRVDHPLLLHDVENIIMEP
jgi:hypothetical protein